MIQWRVSCLAAVLVVLAIVVPACSSSDDNTPAVDAGAQGASSSSSGNSSGSSSSSSGGVVDSGGGSTDAGAEAGQSTPCSMVAGANGLGTKKMQKLATEVATGGVPKEGVYHLKYWGKQNANVGVAYELEVNLTLKLGTPNTYAVGEYYMAGSHSGGGTFTIDEAAKMMTFTKTCGEINIGLNNVDKALYSVTPDEFKLFNFSLYSQGNILIFTAPL